MGYDDTRLSLEAFMKSIILEMVLFIKFSSDLIKKKGDRK